MFQAFRRPSSPRGASPKDGAALYPTVAPPTDLGGIVIESKDDGSKYLDIGAKTNVPTSNTPSIYPTVDAPDKNVVRLARDGGGSGAYPVVVAWKPGQQDGKESVSDAAVAPVTKDSEPAYVANHVADVAALQAAKMTAANEEQKIEEGVEEPQVAASEEVLVAVPGVTEVHLVTGSQNVLIGSGEFKLVRISQGNTGLMVLAKVGDLTWPLLGTEPVAKITDRRYLVTVLVPREPGDDEEEDVGGTSSAAPPSNSKLSKVTSKVEIVKSFFGLRKKKGAGKVDSEGSKEADLLSYGVSFASDVDPKYLAALDENLKLYSQFSVQPAIGALDRKIALSELAAQKYNDGKTPGSASTSAPVPTTPTSPRDRSEQFWSEVAPNVDDYNSTAAKQIALTTGYVIRAVIGVADTAASTIESGGNLVKSKTSAATTGANVSPVILRSVRRVRKFSKLTDDVAGATLNGIIRVSGFFTGVAIKSSVGQAVVKMLPGEVVLVSLDAFGKLIDALEISSKTVLQTSSVVTSDVISHKYGAKAGEVTSETLKTGGHVLHTAWTVSKLRNVLNPKAAISGGGLSGAVHATASAAHTVGNIKKQAESMKAAEKEMLHDQAKQPPSVDEVAGGGVAGTLAKAAVKHAVFGKKGGPGFVEQVGQIALNHVVDQLKKPPSGASAASSSTPK